MTSLPTGTQRDQFGWAPWYKSDNKCTEALCSLREVAAHHKPVTGEWRLSHLSRGGSLCLPVASVFSPLRQRKCDVSVWSGECHGGIRTLIVSKDKHNWRVRTFLTNSSSSNESGDKTKKTLQKYKSSPALLGLTRSCWGKSLIFILNQVYVTCVTLCDLFNHFSEQFVTMRRPPTFAKTQVILKPDLTIK